MCAGDTAEWKVSYVTPFKKQIIGPREAKAIEVYESKGLPDQSFAVDVKVHTPEVRSPGCASMQRALPPYGWLSKPDTIQGLKILQLSHADRMKNECLAHRKDFWCRL